MIYLWFMYDSCMIHPGFIELLPFVMVCRNLISVSCLQFSIAGNSFNLTNLMKKQHRFPSSFLSLLPMTQVVLMKSVSATKKEWQYWNIQNQKDLTPSWWPSKIGLSNQIDSMNWPGEVQQTRSFMTLSKQLEMQKKQIKANNLLISIVRRCQKLSTLVNIVAVPPPCAAHLSKV